MGTITLTQYNYILNTTYDEKSIKLIKKLDEGTQLAINGIWGEYQEYFKKINCTGITGDNECGYTLYGQGNP